MSTAYGNTALSVGGALSLQKQAIVVRRVNTLRLILHERLSRRCLEPRYLEIRNFKWTAAIASAASSS